MVKRTKTFWATKILERTMFFSEIPSFNLNNVCELKQIINQEINLSHIYFLKIDINFNSINMQSKNKKIIKKPNETLKIKRI